MNLPTSIIVVGRELARKLSDSMVDNDHEFDFNVLDKNTEHYEFCFDDKYQDFVGKVVKNNAWLGDVLI